MTFHKVPFLGEHGACIYQNEETTVICLVEKAKRFTRQSEISTALRSLLAMTQLYKGRFTMALPRRFLHALCLVEMT